MGSHVLELVLVIYPGRYKFPLFRRRGQLITQCVLFLISYYIVRKTIGIYNIGLYKNYVEYEIDFSTQICVPHHCFNQS